MNHELLTKSLHLILSDDPQSIESLTDSLLDHHTQHGSFGDHLGISMLAYASLARSRPALIDGTMLAKILTQLTRAESAEGGPYRTMSGEPGIDFDTNIIIGYFLSLQDVSLEPLNNYLDLCIQEGAWKSSFLPSEFFLVFFLSYFYEGSEKETLTDYLLACKPDTAPEAMLVAASLENLKGNLAVPVSAEPTARSLEESTILNLILTHANRRFSDLEDDMKERAIREMQKTIKGNSDGQMSLMSLYTKQALGTTGERFSDEFLAELGLANIFYWTAFVIYDDFWDEDEAAAPQALPVANLYARHYATFFASLHDKKTGFASFFQNLMDRLDEANHWETQYCRTHVTNRMFAIPHTLPAYGTYERKFQPASGHILGPVAMLVNLGYAIDSPEVRHFIDYFRHYLIAMQINDDAHDWEEDMARGHLSTVVVMLLEDFKKQHPYAETIHLDHDRSKLQEVFWFTTLPRATQVTLAHTHEARSALKNIPIFSDLIPLERFITIHERIAKRAEQDYHNSTAFISNYIADENHEPQKTL